jgi:hypothetical protein
MSAEIWGAEAIPAYLLSGADPATVEATQVIHARRLRAAVPHLLAQQAEDWRRIRALTLLVQGRLTTEEVRALLAPNAARFDRDLVVLDELQEMVRAPVAVEPLSWVGRRADEIPPLRQARLLVEEVTALCWEQTRLLWWRLKAAAGAVTVEEARDAVGVGEMAWASFDAFERALRVEELDAVALPLPGLRAWVGPGVQASALAPRLALQAAAEVAVAQRLLAEQTPSAAPVDLAGFSVGAHVRLQGAS